MTKKINKSEPEEENAASEESGEETKVADNDADEQQPTESAQTASETDVFKKDLEEMKARYYRALADYQNLQRRSAKEILEARGRGIEDFAKKLLPVLDTMEKALEQISQTNVDKKVMDGLEMFSIQFTDMLEKEGLKPIIAKGQKFDPNFHEAMCKKCVENVEDEIVITEFEKGYTFKERVLRTAKVEINQL